MSLLLIGLGGLIGAIARFQIVKFVNTSYSITLLSVPIKPGIMLVNILGSVLLGIITALVQKLEISEDLKNLITVGFLGSLTTFSTFSLEIYELLKQNNFQSVILYVLLSVILSILGLFFGFKIFS